MYKKFAETAATTGRTRRVGWLDLEIVRTAAELSGVTEMCLTKLDVLSGLDEIQICTGYQLNGSPVRYADVDAYGLEKVNCSTKLSQAGRRTSERQDPLRNLPSNAQAYIRRIEEAAGVPVQWIGVGPEREATIRR